MRSVLFALVCLFAVSLAQNEWTVIHKRVATLGTGITFFNENDGIIAGADNGIGTVVLQTTNGGLNFTRQNATERDSFMILDLDMADPDDGVFSGVGMLRFGCSAYTEDGDDWIETDERHLFCAFQDVEAISKRDYVLIGEWAKLTDTQGNGVQISTDGGKRFHDSNWDQNTPARYGSFVSTDIGFVSGGEWPETPAERLKSRRNGERRITERISIVNDRFYMHDISHNGVDIPGYQAVIAKYNKGDWTTLFNQTGSIYFNGIFAADENNIWAAAEGINSTTGAPAAYVYYSGNGGQTWNIQLYLEEGSMINVAFLNTTYGWAIGGEKTGDKLYGTYFLTTNGGLTWTSYAVKDVYPFNISLLNANLAFSVAFAPGSSTDLLKWGPSS
jgi:photosystem II stability/assembly factor-like uncharacterized protein